MSVGKVEKASINPTQSGDFTSISRQLALEEETQLILTTGENYKLSLHPQPMAACEILAPLLITVMKTLNLCAEIPKGLGTISVGNDAHISLAEMKCSQCQISED